MTQEPEDRDLTPEEDARVRALLADLGASTTPPEVAARLDDALAALVAEREGSAREPEPEPELAEVVPLRARWLPAAAAAAAVVVVLGGVGVATGVFRSVAGDTAASRSTSADTAGGGSAGSGSGSAEEAPGTASSPPAALAAEVPTLSTARFGAQVTELVRAAGRDGVPLGGTAADGKAQQQRRSPDCPGPSVTDGSSVQQVVLDGRAAVLVVHPARGGSSLAEAWSCDGGTRLTDARVSP